MATLADGLPREGWLLGVDPGARHSAACLLHGGQVVEAATWHRHHQGSEAESEPWGSIRWALRVRRGVAELVARHVPDDVPLLVGVERVVAPSAVVTQHGRRVNATRLIAAYLPDTGTVYGLVAEWAIERGQQVSTPSGLPLLVPVRPRGHDRHPIALYPPSLRGRRPKHWPAQTGDRGHEKAAYSIAVTAGMQRVAETKRLRRTA